MKQTAVEWLVKQLEGVYESDYLNKLVEQAKEMEKEQICKAWNDRAGFDKVLVYTDRRTAEQYYNETYKQQEQ